MKNKIYMLIILVIVLFPIKAYAAKIKTVEIGEVNDIKTGDIVNIPVYIDFFGVNATDPDSFGIGGIIFDIDYDNDVFYFVKAKASGFNTSYDKEDNIIESIIDGGDILENTCTDNVLYCGKYEVILTFYVNDTDKTSSIIKVNDVVAMGYQLVDGVAESYDEEDIQMIEASPDKGRTFNILKGEVIKEVPKVETTNNTASNEKTLANIVTKKKEEINNDDTKDGLSSNNYLKELNVKGYILDFYKRTFDYELEIEEGVNKLKIEAISDSDKATVTIVGADDLKENNNKVLVKVKAEDGNVRTYTINITRMVVKEQKKLTSTLIMDKVNDIWNDYKNYIIIGGLSLLLIIIIGAIIGKINDKKLGDKFDNF